MVGQQDLCSSACEGVTKNFIVNFSSQPSLNTVSLPTTVLVQTAPITNCHNDLRDALVSCLDCYASDGQTPPDDIQTITASLNSCTASDASSPPPSPKPTASALPLRIVPRSAAEDTALPILGALVGGIVSGLVCLGILGTVIVCLCRRSQRRESLVFASPMALEAALPVEQEMESIGPRITGTNRRQRLSATPWTDPTITVQRPRPALRRQLTTRAQDVHGIYPAHRSDSHLPLLTTGERKLRPSTSQSALSERTSYGPSRQPSAERLSPTAYYEPRSASAMTFHSSRTSITPTTPGPAVVPTTPPPYASPYLGSRRRAASAASLESHDDWSLGIGHALSMREARRKGASVGACAPREETSHRGVEEGSSRDRGVGTSSGSANESTGSVAMSGAQTQWEMNARGRRKLQRARTPQKQRSVDLF